MSGISCRLGIGLGRTTGTVSDKSKVAALWVDIARLPGISWDTTVVILKVVRVGIARIVSARYGLLSLWALVLQSFHFAKQNMFRDRYFSGQWHRILSTLVYRPL